MVDWRLESNIIRANPNFHNQPRYDYALVNLGNNEYIFGQILYIFHIVVDKRLHHLALFLPYDKPNLRENRPRDKELRITRLYRRPREASVFIKTNTIVRGGLLVEDFASAGPEHLVVNFIDQDMWMRLKSIKLVTNAPI